MKTRPDGVVLRGLKIGDSEYKSGDTMPASYGQLSFDRDNWPTDLKNGSVMYANFICTDVVYLSENALGTVGVCAFEADTWHRVPIVLRADSDGPLYMKAGSAVAMNYFLEVAL